jgi:hypothetical protein
MQNGVPSGIGYGHNTGRQQHPFFFYLLSLRSERGTTID